eukprot:5660518-Ditylum_brightwellii.AAC.1
MEALRREKEVKTKMWRKLITSYEQKVDVLEKETENINKEYEKLENAKAKLAAKHGNTNATDDDFIEINAGGRVITARQKTLTYQKGTMLEAMFSGRWDKEIQRDGLDRIFLDVNPECFQ